MWWWQDQPNSTQFNAAQRSIPPGHSNPRQRRRCGRWALCVLFLLVLLRFLGRFSLFFGQRCSDMRVGGVDWGAGRLVLGGRRARYRFDLVLMSIAWKEWMGVRRKVEIGGNDGMRARRSKRWISSREIGRTRCRTRCHKPDGEVRARS